MPARSDSLPDGARCEAGATLFSKWTVGTPERQRAAVAAITAVWEHRPWPTRDLLSYNVFTGTDGDTVLHFSRWTSEDAYHDFVRTQRRPRVDEIDAAVPGIERLGVVVHELYRSHATEGGARVPGCFVVVDVEFDGPDRQRQRDWVDAVFDAFATEPHLHPGLIAAHFHLSTDGSRVLNYAEWTSEQAHKEALRAPGAGIGSATPEWHRVQNFPGLKGSHIKRYLFQRSFTEHPPAPPA